MGVYNVTERKRVENEKERTKHQTLQDALFLCPNAR